MVWMDSYIPAYEVSTTFLSAHKSHDVMGPSNPLACEKPNHNSKSVDLEKLREWQRRVITFRQLQIF